MSLLPCPFSSRDRSYRLNSHPCAADAADVSQLAAKLGERDAQHDEDTKDLRAQARKVEGLEEELSRLRSREEELKRQAREEREWLEAAHRAEITRL